MMMLSNIGQMISIHALREEGDLPRFFWTEAGALYFYPRPPRGGRPMTSRYFTIFPDFYPRPP